MTPAPYSTLDRLALAVDVVLVRLIDVAFSTLDSAAAWTAHVWRQRRKPQSHPPE